MIEAIVFDLGHTLVDFALNQELLLAAHLEGFGLLAGYLLTEAPRARQQVNEMTQRIERRIEKSRLRQDLHELNLPAEFTPFFNNLGLEIPESLKQQVACLAHRALRAETHLSPANAEALREVKAAGFRLSLVSNFGLACDSTRALLDDLGLLEPLEVVVLSSEAGIGTPDPRIYQAVLESLGIEARRAVFVGDRIREDVAGPQAVGMRAILTRQFRREESEPPIANPDGVIDWLADLPAAIRALDDAVGI